MEICFTKKEDDKHVLSCKRKDGTVTWINADEFFLRHDILHYAVETVLNFKWAFYGMITKGIVITDFDQPKNKRNTDFSNEALLAEHIVNLIMIETREGLFDDFNCKLKESIITGKQYIGVFILIITSHRQFIQLINIFYWNGIIY